MPEIVSPLCMFISMAQGKLSHGSQDGQQNKERERNQDRSIWFAPSSQISAGFRPWPLSHVSHWSLVRPVLPGTLLPTTLITWSNSCDESSSSQNLAFIILWPNHVLVLPGLKVMNALSQTHCLAMVTSSEVSLGTSQQRIGSWGKQSHCPQWYRC